MGQQQLNVFLDEYLLQLWKRNLVAAVTKSNLQKFNHEKLRLTFLTIKIGFFRNCFVSAMEGSFPEQLALINKCREISINSSKKEALGNNFTISKALLHFGINEAWIDGCTRAIIDALIESISLCEIKGAHSPNPKLRHREKSDVESIIEFLLRGVKAENSYTLPANIDKVRKDFLAVCREHLDTIGGDMLSRLSESFADGRIEDQLNKQMLNQLFPQLESQRGENTGEIDSLISRLLETCSGALVVPQNGDPYEENKMEVAGFQDKANQDPGKVVEVLRPGVRYKNTDLLKAVVELSS